MSNALPVTPYIYHITHVDNLSPIIEEGGLWSDAAMLKQDKISLAIGMSDIKQRRLNLPVKCYPQDYVGEYVPFYFCPRSIMLYLIYRGNHPEMNYRSGQRSIIHLEVELHKAIEWAETEECRWAFSLSNAGAVLTEFRNRLEELHEIDWEAVEATDFRDHQVKEGKQAEFLIYEFFPWHLVQRIGVKSYTIQSKVLQVLAGASHRPVVQVIPHWYY